MGLAASQARLLLLTARKSDLEYKAQCITNTEMILAMQTEAVARKYSQKISNQALFYTNADDANNRNVALTSKNFMQYVANAKALGYKLKIKVGDSYLPYEDEDYKPTTYPVEKDITDPDGNVLYKAGSSLSEAEYNKLVKDYEKNLEHLSTILACIGEKEIGSYGSGFNEIGLLEALNNGSLIIVNENNEKISLSASTGFVEAYYTDDDADAEAEYKRETAAIQVKEKRLQMELQQVESQQKACETEIDSVKKVIEKNIEKTFKVFS